MTRGVVIFAISTPEIDYGAMARWSAKRIKRHLGLPVTIVDTNDREPGQRWFGDIGDTVTWHNTNRADAYALSPYDETLVLDADYIVNSDRLLSLFDTTQEFLAMGQAYDVTALSDENTMNTFGRNRMPMAWATVMMFRRGALSQSIFDIMSMVRENWTHYRDLYNFERTAYRNDYALSIALNMVHGHTGTWPSIPWSMATVDPQHSLSQVDKDTWAVQFMGANQRCFRVTVREQDLHAMCKQQLGAIVASQG